jgi:hypothetical protein
MTALNAGARHDGNDLGGHGILFEPPYHAQRAIDHSSCRHPGARVAHLASPEPAGSSARSERFAAASELRGNRQIAAEPRDDPRLADALGMPLRERNALLVSAGFAPKYRHTELTSPEMAPVRRAIEFILQHQEPYPAIVTNRHWDMLLTNDATVRIFSMLRPGGPKHANVLHQIFDPDDMRSVIANWEELAVDIIRHLHNQVAVAPSDTKSRKLLEEVLAYPGVPEGWRTREPGSAPQPLMNTVFGNGEVELRFFSTITTFGTPHDVTLDELRIECMFPADEATAETCRNAEVTAAATSPACRAPSRSPGPKPP